MARVAWLLVLAACGSSEVTTREPVVVAAPIDDAAAVRAEPAKPAAPAVPGKRLPDVATPLAYDLRLELDPDKDTFRGKVEITTRLARATDHVWLHAERIEVQAASYRAGSRTGELTDLKLKNEEAMRGWSFGATVPAGEVTLVFEYTGKIAKNDAEGLFRQQVGGRWYLFAQSESVYARRITPCFDEPRWKPTWRVTLVVPERQLAFANGAQLEEKKAGGKRELTFAEIAKMPSYLLSVAVGPFAIVDAGKVGRDGVPARVIVPQGIQNNVGVVKLKLPAVVDALENYLDRALPLAKLDLVAIPQFFGAMENIGLVTFEDSILVGDPKKSYVPRRFMKFAAHELAHQWFGNAVTMSWWDDLWISEGFATWLGDKIADQLGASSDPAMRRQLARLHALGADDEEHARPLRRPSDDDEVEERFDAIAYQKGGALLEMIERFVGEERFRDAMRAYIAKHAGTSISAKDVVAAVATISADAGAVLQSYLDIAGPPLVTLKVDCAANTIEARAAHGTVPVCVKFPGGDGKPQRACVAATPTKGTIATPACPAWVIGNADGEGYYRIADPALARSAPMNASERITYADDFGAAVARGDLAFAAALKEIRDLRGQGAIGRFGAASIAFAIYPLVDDALRSTWQRWLGTTFAGVKGGKTLIDQEANERLWPLLRPPYGTKVKFDKVIAQAKARPEEERGDILDALGGYGPAFAAPLAEAWLGGTFKSATVWPAVATLMRRPSTRTAMWRAIVAHKDKVLALPNAELDKLIEATGRLCEPAFRAEVVELFTPVRDSAKKLPRPLAAIDRCIARRARLGDLATALKAP